MGRYTSMVRNVVALASNAIERQVIAMWLGSGYVYATIERRLRDKRRIYRRLGRDERDSRIDRKLTCENVCRVAQYEARRRPGDWKLNARIIRASLRAWADALRALGKPVPTWLPQAPHDLVDEYWLHTRRLRNFEEKTAKDHRLYITWFLKDLQKRKIEPHAIALTDVDHFVSTLTTQRKLALRTA